MTTLPLERMAVVRGEHRDLKHAGREESFMQSLAGHDRSVTSIRPVARQVQKEMASGAYDGWHFICHGSFSEQDPDQSPLYLSEHEELTPDHLLSEAAKLGVARPLVFLNACRAARGAQSLTGFGGWARGFLEAGAGAFVAPLWSVRESRALRFAKTFYGTFTGGRTLGEAILTARDDLRTTYPGDPTWLAYVAFGMPDALCRGAEVSGPPAAPPSSVKKKRETAPKAAKQSRILLQQRGKVHRDGSQMVLVPAGTYRMGAMDGDEWSRPEHAVTLNAFWISRAPVTNAQYARFLKAVPAHPEPAFWHDDRFNQAEQPVVGVCWADAQAYCRWAGLQLPTEAQWEAAARGREGLKYPWGNTPPSPQHANFGGHVGRPTPVGSHLNGTGPFGTVDQAGNVWEWCVDSWSLTAYRERRPEEVDPVRDGSKTFCVVRGGSWLNPGKDLSSTHRDRVTASRRQNDVGFRCVLPWAE